MRNPRHHQRHDAKRGEYLLPCHGTISFLVDCKTQEEVDELWEKLSAGGAIEQCGWLRDRYGVSWPIVPTVLVEMLHDKDAKKSEKVMQAMLKMKKIDINTLRTAYQS